MSIELILEKQKNYFLSGATLSVDFRIQMLKKLYDAVKKYEGEIEEALRTDLGKSDFEGFMCEIGLVLNEISYLIKHTKGFAKEKRVKTPLTQFASRSYKKPCPYGNTLIMSPWNYPFLLTIDPLAEAIAAGNTAIVKPSAYSPAVSRVIAEIVKECFPEEFVAVVTGGRKENGALLKQKFDFIFFTGGQSVGKEVLRNAAEHLTPVVLELGGKSPCIVDDTAKIKLAAKRIVFGKYLNCGQTCVAPDYILCQKSVKDELIKEIKVQIQKQYGKEPFENKDYGKIVNEKHFERICGLIDEKKVVIGGNSKRESLQIEPTLMDEVTWEDAVMQEEIFGPVLPILTFENFEEVIEVLKDKAKPLALYIFSENKYNIEKITSQISYGGGCINDCVIHLATSEMGFGGVGESGMGSYHGKTGFDAFSHTKSIVDKKTWMDLPMRYQPYDRGLYSKLLHIFFEVKERRIMSVKIIVDSTADLAAAVKEQVKIVPLTVHFGEEEFLDGVTIDYVQFYEKLVSSSALPTTSQPNPAAFEAAYKEAIAEGHDVVVVTISSKLSGTCQSATIAAADYDNVYVVDSKTAAIGVGVLVDLALQWAAEGMSAKEIAEKLEEEKGKVKIVALIDTLEFLQRGGRISKTVALAGSMLSIKPIIGVQDGVIDMVAKVRGAKQGSKQIAVEAEKMGEIDYSRPIMLAFTGVSSENLEKYEAGYGDFWRKEGAAYDTTALGSAIGTHIGPGAVAASFFVK